MTMIIMMGSVSAVDWKAVNYASPEAIAKSGLTVEEFNNLSKADWEKLLAEKKNVNFAFSLQDGEGKDITNSSNPNVSINVNGLSDSQIVQFEDVEVNSNINPELVGEVYTFTNAGKVGRYGPSQSHLDNAYQGTNLEGKVISNNGIQEWIVPAEGKYRITAYGAQGGAYGGNGAIIRTEIVLKNSNKLHLLVGQKGASHNGKSSGGGGGTFVVQDNLPLVVAGGGSGRINGNSSLKNNGTTKTDSTYSRNYGIGYGGKIYYNNSYDPREGAGAAGFIGDGEKGNNDYKAYSFLNGGSGASGWETGYGGFGGGGGYHNSGSNVAGGGGGYTGGSAGYNNAPGGGGSYIDSLATNIATSDGKYNNSTTFNFETIENLNSYNTGHGKVIIEYLGE